MASKKSFMENNPAMQFISGEQEQQQAAADSGDAVPVKKPKYAPIVTEAKKRRVQLALRPSLYDKVKAEADACGISFNDFVHRVLEDVVNEG